MPECMGQCGNFVMPEGWDAMAGHRLGRLVRSFRMFESLPGMLVSAEVFLFPLLFHGAVGMRGKVVQLGGPLMIFVMGSVVISSRHG